MGKILDARGDEAIDVLSALIDPVSAIAADEEIGGMMRGETQATVMQLATAILKRHKAEVIEIMAIDDGVTPDEERGLLTAMTIPVRLMRLISTPAVRELLFGSAETKPSATGSSSASKSAKE